jgi:metal-responsive CopG/Arc/MetJ family transcriptional regulator
MKTIQMTIDPTLLKAVDNLKRLRKTTLSALIRSALEAELLHERIKDLETRHIAGYTEYPSGTSELSIWLDQQDWGGR